MTSVSVCHYCGRLGTPTTPVHNLAVGSVYACQPCIDGRDPLEGMTADRWSRVEPRVRSVIRDPSGLTPQLTGYEGWRVHAVRLDGSSARFIVGRSTGWRPCHIEVKRVDSRGGLPADREYRHVTPIKRVR